MSSTLTQEVVDEVTTTTATTASSSVEVSQAPSAAVRRLARTHRYIARLLLGGIAVQYFFAGLGVFGITSFLPHVIFGTSLVIASFALPIIAWRGHLARTALRRSWLLAGLMILQGGLIDAGRVIPLVSAFHPVNALLIALVTFTLI
jgi:hypothetical protein